MCVCPGPNRCLQPNVARHTAGGTEQAVTQRPQAGREGPRHLRTWCKRTHPPARARTTAPHAPPAHAQPTPAPPTRGSVTAPLGDLDPSSRARAKG